MGTRTLAELVAPDQRNVQAGFLEARRGGGFDMEIAARFVQEYVRTQLHDDVPMSVASGFERARSTFIYGLFDYELFTAASDQSLLLLEPALKARFISLYNGVVTLVSLRKGGEHPIKTSDFEAVRKRVNGAGFTVKLTSGQALSLLDRKGRPQAFNGSLGHLLAWARQEDLLTGQRARLIESLLEEARHRVAHPEYHLEMPAHAALTLNQVGQIINRLWGHETPGSRLYPAPVERTTIVVGWAEGGDRCVVAWPDQLAAFADPRDWTFIVLLAVPRDQGLLVFDARYERTEYPAELLWGAGRKGEALEWLARNPATETSAPPPTTSWRSKWSTARPTCRGAPRSPLASHQHDEQARGTCSALTISSARSRTFVSGRPSDVTEQPVQLPGHTGRLEEALTSVEKAATTYRELAEARPDTFRPDVAMSMNNRCSYLAALGRLQEALRSIEEAISICGQLSEARPDIFRPALAMSLEKRSAIVRMLGE